MTAGFMASGTAGQLVLGVIGLAILLAFLALWRAGRKNQNWRRIRIGFFVERDRFGSDDRDPPDTSL